MRFPLPRRPHARAADVTLRIGVWVLLVNLLDDVLIVCIWPFGPWYGWPEIALTVGITAAVAAAVVSPNRKRRRRLVVVAFWLVMFDVIGTGLVLSRSKDPPSLIGEFVITLLVGVCVGVALAYLPPKKPRMPPKRLDIP